MKLPVAVEIGEHYLKISVAAGVGLKFGKLFSCSFEPVSFFTDEQITKVIAEHIRRLKFKPKSLSISIPRNLVTVRNLHLPSQDPKEISQILSLHISRIVPYRKEEIYFGYQLLGTDSMGYAKEILAIVHNNIIKRQTKILSNAGLMIDRVVLSSYGAWQWALRNSGGEINRSDLYLLLDIDSSFADFIIFSRDNLLFSRSINLEFKNAFDKEDITKLIGEVRQSLVIFQNEEINKRPAKIFLSGAGLNLDLAEEFKREFDIPVKTVPFPSVDAVKNAAKPEIVNASLSAVAELVLANPQGKSLSFIIPEIQIRKNLKERTKELALLGVLLIYLLTVTLGFFWGRTFIRQVYLRNLLQQKAAIGADVGNLIEYSKKVDQVKVFLIQRKAPLLLYSQLQDLTPTDIGLNFLNLDEQGKVTLRGQGMQLSDVFKFIATLENSKFFHDVQARYTRTKRVKDREVTEFELVFQLEDMPK